MSNVVIRVGPGYSEVTLDGEPISGLRAVSFHLERDAKTVVRLDLECEVQLEGCMVELVRSMSLPSTYEEPDPEPPIWPEIAPRAKGDGLPDDTKAFLHRAMKFT